MRIILIGGVPRTGKTTLAQKISHDMGLSWISTDALESIAYSYTSPENESALFPKAHLKKSTDRTNDDFYDMYTTEEIVDAYTQQADTTAKAIVALVTYADKGGWGYVIEGYHITPKLIAELRNKGIAFSSIILINTKPHEAIERSRTSTTKNDWVRDDTHREETFSKIATVISAHSNRLLVEAEKLDVTVVDMSLDFESRFNDVYESLVK